MLLHHVARAVADAGLEARERDRGEAPQRPEVGGRLAGVADPELDVVDAVERQEVLRLGEGVLVEVRAGLVGGGRADAGRRGRSGFGMRHATWLRAWRSGGRRRGRGPVDE